MRLFRILSTHIITSANTSQKYHFQHVNSERKQQITTSPGQNHHNKIIFKIKNIFYKFLGDFENNMLIFKITKASLTTTNKT